MMRRRAFVTATLLVSLLIAGQGSAIAWNIQWVSPKSWRNSVASDLVLGGSGRPTVTWWSNGSDTLHGATTTRRGDWQTTILSGAGKKWCYSDDQFNGPSIARGPNGVLGIAHGCDGVYGATLKYTSKVEGKWKTVTIGEPLGDPEQGGPGFTAIDLVFDPSSGRPVIVYGETSEGNLIVARKTGAGWTQEIAVSGYFGGGGVDGPAASAAFDLSGNLVIASNTTSFEDGSLELYTEDGFGGWEWEYISTGDVLGQPSLAFKDDGTPLVAFQQGTSTNSHLALATRSGLDWEVEAIDATTTETGKEPSLVLFNNLPRIAYQNDTSDDLRYATFDGATWTLATVFSSEKVGGYPSLALTATGMARISFYDETFRRIGYAKQ